MVAVPQLFTWTLMFSRSMEPSSARTMSATAALDVVHMTLAEELDWNLRLKKSAISASLLWKEL